MKPWERFGPQKKPWEMTASELQARVDSAPVGSVGAPGGALPAEFMGRGQTGPGVSDALLDPEFWTRDVLRNAADQLPAMGGLAAGLSVPGLGLGALAAGAGAGAGSIVDSAVGELMDPGGRPRLDLGKAGTEAAVTAGTTLAVGGLFRLLFGKGSIDDVAEGAASYAKEKGLPMRPPGLRGKIAGGLGRVTALGELEYARQAAKVGQAIDDEIAALAPTQNADEIAVQGRKLLRTRFDPRLLFKQLQEAIPKELPIRVGGMLSSAREAAEKLGEIGDDALRTKLQSVVAGNSDDAMFAFDQADGLMTELQRLCTPANSKILDSVIGSLKDDIAASVNEVPEIAAAVGGDVRELYNVAGKHSFNVVKALKEIPTLKQMMSEGMTAPQFLAKFSTSASVRKAIKEIAPDLHNELATAWLGRNLEMRASDGAKFAMFMKENQNVIREMFPAEKVSALTNFAAYLRYSQELVKQGGKISEIAGAPWMIATRLGASSALLGPGGVAPIEGAGYALVNRLLTPGSGIWRLFAEGPGKAAIPAGVITGQAGQGIAEEIR